MYYEGINKGEMRMIYVYELPVKMSDGYCFGGGKPITFINVDWMDSAEGLSKKDFLSFIKPKVWRKAGGKYACLDTEGPLTMIIHDGLWEDE